MLDLKLIMKDKEKVKEALSKRKNVDLGKVNKLYKKGLKRSKLTHQLEEKQAELNKSSKELAYVNPNDMEFKTKKRANKKLKRLISRLEKRHLRLEDKVKQLVLEIPNIPNEKAPIGKNEDDNVIEKEFIIGRGKIKHSRSHDEIGKELDIIDMVRSAKISGSRFTIYKKQGAKILRALQSFCLQENIDRGYEELIMPVIVNTQALYGTGQLPKFAVDLFRLNGREQWLIPTGEVTLTNYYSDEIIDLSKPKCLTTYSLCFRSEAGSGGKDTKGIIRMHQFNKVELVKITRAEDMEIEYKKMIDDVEHLIIKLEIPYRKVILCTGDLGFSSEYTTDIEIWFPSQGVYREVSSISMFGDFQARRAKIRYKENGVNKFASTINGSGLALDRILAAIIENYYDTATKKIEWPNILKKYI